MLTEGLTKKLKDRHLKTDIESCLLELDLLPGEHIEIDVKNQCVTLMGEVYTPSMKYIAEYEVMRFPLVVHIMNLIRVHSPPAKRKSTYEYTNTEFINDKM